ncbi:MAG: isoleucine--tRNA ligase [Candidatus Omnitrophota bacterium]
MNYKDTLNLPKTTFSMKANLVQKEPAIIERWNKTDIYGTIRKERKGKKKFILHDGPPYANGHIHMGHVLNKILKDIVVKFYTLKGFDSPFIPGWDCHGLPVEHQLFKELKISRHDIDQVDFRKKSAKYAMKFVDIQREEFKRLGVFGDWERPYLTLDPKYESSIIRSFGKLVRDGYVYRDLKPVNWCTTCETALAEAEVEYEDHRSPSIYVKFKVIKLPDHQVAGLDIGAYFIIWTTTPWTLLGNVGIALNPDRDYAVIKVGDETWVMLESLVEATLKKLQKEFKVIGRTNGRSLHGTACRHPFIERESKVVFADYVSGEEGTGCVHTAPGHGQEDYLTGKKYDLPIIMPVDAKGNFDTTCGEFSGLNIHKAGPGILERLKKERSLLFSGEIAHSYPHCWRCKNPVISRATKQYFIRIDHEALRENVQKIINDRVRWYPAAGKGRISAMVENRPDWCISRQRYWGVPIVAFRCKQCEEVLLDPGAIEFVAKIVEREGTDAWFIRNPEDLVPKGASCGKCGCGDFIKERDIVDVWFESGVSHQSVLKNNPDLLFPCQLYLEGSDQHRGWFQSSIITSYAIEKTAPYEGVITHGFVVDGSGKKMSKSLGNVISPQDVMKKYGADILRLWVASSNYQDDIRLSEEILQRLADAYRKIRNTLRYLLGNLYDFDRGKDYIRTNEMPEIDRWVLSRLASIVKETDENYSEYMFYKVFRSVYNFCIYEISSIYLDASKDRLYTYGKNSRERRSCQTVLYEVLNALLGILAPILSFTAEEAYQALYPDGGSVHLSCWDRKEDILKERQDRGLCEKWSHLLDVRAEVLKSLEEMRASNMIGSSLEARVELYSDEPDLRKLLDENAQIFAELFITSQVEVSKDRTDNFKKSESLPLWISIQKASGKKCNRCWNYSPTVGSDREFIDCCCRCADVVRKIDKAKIKGGA